MRRIVVGDIHGCLDEFDQLLTNLQYCQGVDDLILVGDLIDRGPKSLETVRQARALQARITKGNHEDNMVRFLESEARAAVDPSYKNKKRRPSPDKLAIWTSFSTEEVAWLAAAPDVIEVAGWLVVHAGFENKPMEKQKSSTMQRVRYLKPDGSMASYAEGSLDQPANTVYWTRQYRGTRNVVYGHSVRSVTEPIVETNDNGAMMVAIDTGCCFGGRLSALVIEDDGTTRIAQVQARQVYYCETGVVLV